MAWTAEDRRKYAPAIQEVLRQGMLVRLAATVDRIAPPAKVGRPRLWSTLIMLQASWHLARDGCAWRRLPPGFPPHQTVWSRLSGWRLRAVLDRALAVVVAGRRLAGGGGRRRRSSTPRASGPARSAGPGGTTPTRRSRAASGC
jgi:transposase